MFFLFWVVFLYIYNVPSQSKKINKSAFHYFSSIFGLISHSHSMHMYKKKKGSTIAPRMSCSPS